MAILKQNVLQKIVVNLVWEDFKQKHLNFLGSLLEFGEIVIIFPNFTKRSDLVILLGYWYLLSFFTCCESGCCFNLLAQFLLVQSVGKDIFPWAGVEKLPVIFDVLHRWADVKFCCSARPVEAKTCTNESASLSLYSWCSSKNVWHPVYFLTCLL